MEDLIEVWKDIIGFEDCYQVSNKGNVRSLDRYIPNKQGYKSFVRGKELAKTDNGTGYLYSDLSKNSKTKHYYIHRLVAENFLTSYSEELEVNHIDHDKSNNTVNNLEYITHLENMRKMTRYHGRTKKKVYCKDCSIEVGTKSIRCRKCSDKKIKILAENLPIDKEGLYNLLLVNSFDKVGKRFGITGTSIKKWCIKLGIPSKRSQYPKIPK